SPAVVQAAAPAATDPAPAAGQPTPAPNAVTPQIGDPGTHSWSVRPKLRDGESERPNFSFDLDKGATVSDAVEIRNFGKTDIALKVYAADGITSEIGAVDLLASGEKSTDVGSWITLEKHDVTVEPGKNVIIPFTMKVPDRVESGDHTGGIVTSFLVPSKDQNGNPITIDRRLGSRVSIRVAGPLNPQLSVGKLKTSFSGPMNPLGTGELTGTYTVTNKGNVRMGVRQSLKVKSPIGLPSKSVRPTDIAELLPGDSITVTEKLTGVFPTIRSSIKVSAAPIAIRPGDVFDPATVGAGASTGTWSWPWAFAALVLLLLIGLGIRRRLRAHARLTEEHRVATAVEQATVGRPTGDAHAANGAVTSAPAGFDHGAVS
ncbi:MAG TPA: DUF916 domain-containing protein, partial [Sporichthya sp.]|nr:DUF916 domain-containing protein [Sporichthya sp.]